MSHVISDCLPEDKMNTVSTLQQAGHVVAMVGTFTSMGRPRTQWGKLTRST